MIRLSLSHLPPRMVHAADGPMDALCGYVGPARGCGAWGVDGLGVSCRNLGGAVGCV